MSSATSIKRSRTAVNASEPAVPQTADDQAFRPWHFFVLASLMSATAAVLMTRQSTPEHLILLSITIASAGLAGAGFYRMLSPLTSGETTAAGEALSNRARATLEREKALVLRSLKELEFDRAMNKLSAKDFDEMAGRLRARAVSLMKQLEEGGSGYRAVIERDLALRMREPRKAPAPEVQPADVAPACAACGTLNDPDASFCKRCGGKLA